ncbi:MAG: DciA family protein, partial [Burkholderiales bacterium]
EHEASTHEAHHGHDNLRLRNRDDSAFGQRIRNQNDVHTATPTLMPIRNAKSAGTFLRENTGLKPVQDRFAVLSRLQQSLADTLPAGLKDTCRVATLEGSTLVIAAAHGAAAARLKQMLPRLLEVFRTAPPGSTPESPRGENKIKEQQVTAISVLVQPNFSAMETPMHRATNRTAMPPAMLTELVEKLEDSPLKDALGKLTKKRERGLT